MQLSGRIENQCFFRIRRDPGTEAAAHIRNHNAQMVLRQAQHFAREHATQQMRRLATGMQCELTARMIIDADCDTWLQWIGDDPIVNKRQANNMRRRRHHGIDRGCIADLKHTGDVAGCFGPERRRAMPRGLAQIAH